MQILSTEKIGRLKRNWPRLLLLLVIVVLSLRLIVFVSTSTSGWRSLWNDWEAQVLGLLGQATSVSEEIPSKQAKYWLQKVEQIPETQTDPQVALGAAWMLAEPQYEFLKRDIKTTQDVQELAENLFELRDQSQAEYQALCRAACLKQAAIATHLAPDNVDYWRQRALLLFAVGENSELVPRSVDWQQVLEQAAAHDPENALYDYLAALQFYQLSAESVWDEKHRLTLKITNPRVYAKAEQRLQAGLKKTNLDVGTITWSATLAFLEQTSLPLEEQIAAAESRNAIYSAEIIVIRLLRWLNYACESDLPQKKYAAVICNARCELLIADQLTGQNNLYESTFFKYLFRTSGRTFIPGTAVTSHVIHCRGSCRSKTRPATVLAEAEHLYGSPGSLSSTAGRSTSSTSSNCSFPDGTLPAFYLLSASPGTAAYFDSLVDRSDPKRPRASSRLVEKPDCLVLRGKPEPVHMGRDSG